MKAMVLEKTADICESPLRTQMVTKPVPGPGQIRIRVHVCGVCHTDLHTVEGDLELPKLPVIPGHQLVGTVDEVGVGASKHQIGDRVGVAWLNWACGECTYCREGKENLCPRARFTGLHADGGYAEFAVVDEGFAYPIPERFGDVEAAPLLCAGIVGYRALLLCEVQQGGRLGLYGFGASAHLVIQVAVHWGCDVYVFTRSAAHRKLAYDLGASWAGGAEDACPALLDGSVIFAPVGWMVPLALGHLRPGGTLAINAIHMSHLPEMAYSLIYGERSVRSVANFTRQDAQEFLQIAAEIPVRSEVQLFELADANVALRRLKDSDINGAAVLRIA